MEWSRPGADLLGANEARVLRVLAHRSDALSGREVARLAGVSPSSGRRALDRFVVTGLVSVQSRSHALLYEANPGHVLWGPVRDILAARSTVEGELATLVRERLGEDATVAFFGSVARDAARADSDVDVVLVVPDDTDADLCAVLVDDIGELVRTRSGNEAQVLTVSRSQLQRMADNRDPLVDSWARDAVTLGGPSLSRLLAA